jgi:dTMP kinase
MFIVFEGIDGTGKGTQITRAIEYLENLLGKDVVVQSKDPGGTKLGLALRRVMYEEVPTTEMMPGVVDLIFLASHLQNWQTVVKPALDAGKVVVSDRWWYSQAAYMTQRQVPEPIANAYMQAHGRNCDLLIFLYGSAEVVLGRARARESETHQSAKAWNDQQILEKIQNAYVDQFAGNPEWHPINIDGKTPDQIWSQVEQAIYYALARTGKLPGDSRA